MRSVSRRAGAAGALHVPSTFADLSRDRRALTLPQVDRI